MVGGKAAAAALSGGLWKLLPALEVAELSFGYIVFELGVACFSLWTERMFLQQGDGWVGGMHQ